jgi:D-amino-acid dehydrogenase
MKNIAIIGGGIIGLSSAYYLNQSGHRVTIFDKGDLYDNCSIGNAGMIVPSHIIPLASPGMIAKGIGWMFNSKSPFYVKPRLSSGLIRWGMKFYAHANQRHVHASIPVLKEISMMSRQLYHELASAGHLEFGFQEKGLLMMFKTSETEKEEVEAAVLANKHNVEAIILSPEELQRMEPDVKVSAKGAVYFPGDAHLDPGKLVQNLVGYLQSKGVKFFKSTFVDNIAIEGGKISGVMIKGDTHAFDEVVIAAGAWSGIFCARLNIDLPMQSGKGYSFTLNGFSKNVSVPTLLLEGRVAVTPIGTSLRFGGTMEIGGADRSINMNRVRGIVETIPKYYPELTVDVPKKETVWAGLRPCSPDGLPYIGRYPKYPNLIVATGHSMMGMSLGPATGKLVAELVDEQPTSMDISAFRPERFS